MKEEKLKIGLLYLSFHNSLKKVYGINKIITKEQLIEKLGRHGLVPKQLRVLAIKELESMNLLKKESDNGFKILDYELNIEEDANKFFKEINLFDKSEEKKE